MLELLHAQWSLADVAAAIGTYPREVRRVGWRYLERGVPAALTDDPRPKPPKLLDTRQQAAIVAMVCGPPPAGYARWTVRVTTEESQASGDCRRRGARDHPPGPSAPRAEAVAEKKCGASPRWTLSTSACMEDVLNVLARPYDAPGARRDVR